MQKEDLLKMLHDAGMEDEAIKALLEECLKDMQPAPAEPSPEEKEEAEKKEAEKLLGVSL